MIDRKLDAKYFAGQVGCSLVYEGTPTPLLQQALLAGWSVAAKTKKFAHDSDVQKFFKENESYIVLHDVTYKDSEYTIRYFDLHDHPALQAQGTNTVKEEANKGRPTKKRPAKKKS